MNIFPKYRINIFILNKNIGYILLQRFTCHTGVVFFNLIFTCFSCLQRMTKLLLLSTSFVFNYIRRMYYTLINLGSNSSATCNGVDKHVTKLPRDRYLIEATKPCVLCQPCIVKTI